MIHITLHQWTHLSGQRPPEKCWIEVACKLLFFLSTLQLKMLWCLWHQSIFSCRVDIYFTMLLILKAHLSDYIWINLLKYGMSFKHDLTMQWQIHSFLLNIAIRSLENCSLPKWFIQVNHGFKIIVNITYFTYIKYFLGIDFGNMWFGNAIMMYRMKTWQNLVVHTSYGHNMISAYQEINEWCYEIRITWVKWTWVMHHKSIFDWLIYFRKWMRSVWATYYAA